VRRAWWHNRSSDGLLDRFDRKLDRMDEHMARGNELMEEIRQEHELNRREHELNRQQYRELHEITVRETRLNRSAIQENRSVTRELIVQLREDRKVLDDIRHGIQANTAALLRVLDELRRGEGPSPAGA
jgi:hypothetical protein